MDHQEAFHHFAERQSSGNQRSNDDRFFGGRSLASKGENHPQQSPVWHFSNALVASCISQAFARTGRTQIRKGNMGLVAVKTLFAQTLLEEEDFPP